MTCFLFHPSSYALVLAALDFIPCYSCTAIYSIRGAFNDASDELARSNHCNRTELCFLVFIRFGVVVVVAVVLVMHCILSPLNA